MVVVDAYVDVLSHLRLLRNRIVAGYQNFRYINIGEMTSITVVRLDGSERERLNYLFF